MLPSNFCVSPGSVVDAGAPNTLPQGKIAKPSAADIQQKSTAWSNTLGIRHSWRQNTVKNRYCVGKACPNGLCFAIRSLRTKKNLLNRITAWRKNRKQKVWASGNWFQSAKLGQFTPRLLAVLGVLKRQNCRRLRAYLNQWRETLKLTNLPGKSLLRSKKSSKIYVVFVDNLLWCGQKPLKPS